MKIWPYLSLKAKLWHFELNENMAISQSLSQKKTQKTTVTLIPLTFKIEETKVPLFLLLLA